MTANNVFPTTARRRLSAARASLVIAGFILVSAPVSLCMCSTFFVVGVLGAVFALVPVLIGPVRYRVMGAIVLVLAAAMSAHGYPALRKEGEAYRLRAGVVEVALLGTNVAAALDDRRASGKPLPGSIDELGVTVPRAKVASVGIESADRFVITLALPEATGSALVFVAATADGTRAWKCASRGLAPLARPAACRDTVDAPGSLERR